MADTVKSGSYLNIECVFLDGDMRTITLRNPRSDISATDIEDLEEFITNEQIIIGDRDAAAFRKISRAVKYNKTTTNLDLSN